VSLAGRQDAPANRPGERELHRIERELKEALAAIRFGSIEIVIHDSRVVQIERREKVRFDARSGSGDGS
jgi:hypothetical protein